MNRYNGHLFAVFLTTLTEIQIKLKLPNVKDLEPSQIETLVNGFNKLIQYCSLAEMRLSAISMERAIVELKKETIDKKKLSVTIEEILARIQDELSLLTLVNISAKKLNYFEKPSLFGQQVADNYSSATFEIEEAGNCFALDRNTACVMHLMRTLEIALSSIALGIGLTVTDISANPNWGNILTKVNGKIIANNAVNSPAWIISKAFFENAYTHLNAVRVAWRNPTMHVENTYTEESAEDIFNAVRGLMRHLAKHLDEAGTFTP
jgi:hypothetical protein